MLIICCYDLSIHFLKYILPWYTAHIISHSSILLNQLIPPSSLQYSWLLCTYQTNNISPISIDTDHTFWRIPIHECCTYIIYIICPIIGSCLIGCSEVGIQINARGGGNKIRSYAYHVYVILGWMGGAILANEVHPRRLYIYIVGIIRW